MVVSSAIGQFRAVGQGENETVGPMGKRDSATERQRGAWLSHGQ